MMQKFNEMAIAPTNRKWYYLMFTVLTLLAFSTKSNAQTDGVDSLHAIDVGSYSPNSGWYQTSGYNNQSGLENNWGYTANDVWFKFTITETCIFTASIGTCDDYFNTILYLVDTNGNQLTYNDDTFGDKARIDYALSPGTYYIVLEGHGFVFDSSGYHDTSYGGTGIYFWASEYD